MEILTAEIAFRNPAQARRDAARLSALPPAIANQVRSILESVPDPDQSLHFFERFRLETPDAFSSVCASPAALRYLLTIASYSAFLSESVVRHPGWLLDLRDSGDLYRVLTPEDFESRLAGFRSALDLAGFRRRQLLRIVLRDVLGFASLSDVTEELSNLADAILTVACRQVRAELARQYGTPRGSDVGSDAGSDAEARFSVISLGKLGGRELNYSSDVDLMFLYSANGETSGGLTNKEFFKKVANQFTELLSTYTGEGMCYRVDLRLRPDGRYGEVCQSLEGAKSYYQQRARDWELQMLIKARISAGDTQPGWELLDFVEPSIYSTTTDFQAIESVSEARERIHEKLKRSHQSGIDIKLARGGIRDIEFLVQCLQRLHGGREPWVRHGGTQLALSRLRDKDLLSDAEYARLSSAYGFLRILEHRLQFDEDRQTHSLPSDLAALEILARKLPISVTGTDPDAGTLQRELDGHLTAVQELYDRVIHSQRPLYEEAGPANAGGEPVLFPSANLRRFLSQVAPRFAAQLNSAALIRSRDRVESFLEKIIARRGWDALESSPEVGACVLDLFEHSSFFGDQLVRHPDLIDQVRAACGDRQGRVGFRPPLDVPSLRLFFRQQMMCIQSDSVYHSAPIFKTLKRTSDLADSVLANAYRIAIDEALESAPPLTANYLVANQMMVIALGRLGMREFDLASDADLVFAIPDRDAEETAFWTAVAERVITAVSAYTGDGVLFTVDTRLRPNGREGALVQTESAFRDYFSNHAEAWEGIAYMKARAVAGDIDRATMFLSGLQEVDWRRHGQSGRSRKQLAAIRARVEKEQGARNPLKAGPGGYYDIDFALMYFRLKGAGMFYKSLNTPERINVIEKMGHLEREDAEFLREAAGFYRSLDHALRISSGHAEGRLPSTPRQLPVLSELVRRWDPASAGTSLQERLTAIQQRTRAFFDRVFA